MTDHNEGYEKAQAVRNKLKTETDKVQAAEDAAMEKVKKESSERQVQNYAAQGIANIDPAVAAFFAENQGVGMEEVSTQMPWLKITESNSSNLLADGSKAKAGTFYYMPTRESFDSLVVSLISISKGFYTIAMEKDGKTPKRDDQGRIKTAFNQFVGGIMLDSMQPFVMFAKGIRWNRMNEFVKLMKPYTRSKTMPIPLMAFKVLLDLEEVENNNAVTYALMKGEGGRMDIITDMNVLQVLKKGSEAFQDMFDGYITKNAVDRYTAQPIGNAEIRSVLGVDIGSDEGTETISVVKTPATTTRVEDTDVSDDIPF